jgi:sialate O-acetylesterase
MIDWRHIAAAGILWAVGSGYVARATVPPAALFANVFQDHAVLQREQPISVWGDAPPGDQISVSLGSHVTGARADATGRWRATLPAMSAGGPYMLSARAHSGINQSISDVLIGDVWLCSGQSNMELPVSRSFNAAREISGSSNDLIRLLTVQRASSALPLTHFSQPVAWQPAAPTAISDFSAACYYFARELQKSVAVPMGLIHSSFGGSSIQPWISDEGLRSLEGYAPRLDLLRFYARDPVAGNKALGELWESWWRAHAPADSEPWKIESNSATDWRSVPEPTRDWKSWGVAELSKHDGMVWFRRKINLSPAQAAASAELSLGAIREVDETWVNGQAIGNSTGWGTQRTYHLPAGVLQAGENTIVVNVLSTWDAGGMYGPLDHMALHCADGSVVALGGQWRYQFVPERMGYPPRAPWESTGGLGTLFNAMIAPLVPYAMRGVLWYQGESNSGEADHYQALLTALMADWRKQFGLQLPFLVVELPNFGTSPAAPVDSAWASLREAQRRAVAADRRAALAVTIDVGERDELHPPNKQAVGVRLARAARHLIYGEALSASGPIPSSASLENGHIVVGFIDVDGKLIAYSAQDPFGFELCGVAQSSCSFVSASLRTNQVVLDASAVESPTRVRFCWGGAPICNLYDQSGLPAGPFELAIKKL